MAVRLLGIESAEQLTTHPLQGPLFENWAIVELLKGRFNRGKKSNLFFWLNNAGLEVDVVAEKAGKLLPIGIKSGSTLTTDWFRSLNRWLALAGNDTIDPSLLYGGSTPWKMRAQKVFFAKVWALIINMLRHQRGLKIDFLRPHLGKKALSP